MDIHARSTIAARHARRRFLKRMGLGAAAAPLVLGIGDLLIGRALGQTTRRKMALFFVHGEAWVGGSWATTYTPPGVNGLNWQGGNSNRTPVDGQDQDKPMELPPFFAAFAPWKDRTVLVDGLPLYGVNLNNPSATHGLGNAAMSAVGAAASPGGISIDQHVAAVLSRDTPIKSLNFGLGGSRVAGDETTGAFAASPGAGLPHAQNASALLRRMTGAKPTAPGGSPGAPPTAALGTRLLDLVRTDLMRFDRGLAAEEKALLTEYLASMEAFQKKEAALAHLAQTGGSCSIPGTPPAGMGTMPGIVAMDSMFRLSTLALKCGVTNVVGATMGNTGTHNDLDLFVSGYSSHGGYDKAMASLAPVSMGWVATMLKDLGPLADSMTVTLVPGNGLGHKGPTEHHGGPIGAAFVVDGPRALKTGSRLLRVKRDFADVFTTLAGVLGAPIDKFNNKGAGTIKELMA